MLSLKGAGQSTRVVVCNDSTFGDSRGFLDVSGSSCAASSDDRLSGDGSSGGSSMAARLETLMKEEEELQSIAVKKKNMLNLAMGSLILLNAVCFALETDLAERDADGDVIRTPALFCLESLFCCGYVAEIAVRLRWDGVRYFLFVGNFIDSIIVVCTVLDSWIFPFLDTSTNLGMLTILRLLRLVRLVRLLRVMKIFRGFYAIVMAFHNAMVSMMWICGLILLGLFIASIFTTNFIGHNHKFHGVSMGGYTSDARYGTVARSMFSNFELMTLEGWESVGRPLVATEPALAFFLFGFIMIFTFGLLNMVVALVVEKTVQESKRIEQLSEVEQKTRMAEELRRMKLAFEQVDTDGNGSINVAEFEEAVANNEVVRDCLGYINLPIDNARELYKVLDTDQSGALNIEEFMQGCSKVQGAAPTHRDIIATYAEVRSIRKILASMVRALGCTDRCLSPHGTQSGFVDEGVLSLPHKLEAEAAQNMTSAKSPIMVNGGHQDETSRRLDAVEQLTAKVAERLAALEKRQAIAEAEQAATRSEMSKRLDSITEILHEVQRAVCKEPQGSSSARPPSSELYS